MVEIRASVEVLLVELPVLAATETGLLGAAATAAAAGCRAATLNVIWHSGQRTVLPMELSAIWMVREQCGQRRT